MKLFIVGSSPQAHICLNSAYVSSYHAELLLLDNGDIILTDKSKNGTYVNGTRVQAGKDVSIKRGDTVKFADSLLDWSLIPILKLDSNVVEVKGIGTHYMNGIILKGQFASRFHATMKKKTDGKWYIEDHSKNGTTVNGTKIAPNTETQIRKNDVIACAGETIYPFIPVPVPDPDHRLIKRIATATMTLAVVILSVVVLYNKLHVWTPKEINDKYKSSVCLVITDYSVKLSLDGKERELSGSGESTGFFVSKDGIVVTNHHVTAPWDSPEMAEQIQEARQELINFRNTNNNLKTISEAKHSNYVSVQDYNAIEEEIEISIYIIPNGKMFNIANAIEATKIKSSSSMDVDLGYFQLVTGKLPDGAECIPEKKISQKSTVKVGESITAIGFPMGGYYQKDIENKELQTTTTTGTVTRVEDEITFNFDASITSGSSGSPMFNSHGELVGVASDGYAFNGGNFNGGVQAYLIEKLLNKDLNL